MGYGGNFETKRPSANVGDMIWNILTILILMACIGLAGLFALIYNNPYIPFNPYKPQQLPQIVIVPTFTPTSNVLPFPATWTPTATNLPTFTQIPVTPTYTVTLNSILRTPTILTTANAETPVASTTPTVAGNMPFDIRGNAVAISSTIVHPESDCNWLGVGGQVFDLQDSPAVHSIIQLGGDLNGTPFIDMFSLTGTAQQYGQAGYEFILANKPAASNNTIWLQMLDQAGLALSPRVYFETFDDCQKNLIWINFKQVR
jgi:hypothetical protein